jgi:phosphomevalonate kinase
LTKCLHSSYITDLQPNPFVETTLAYVLTYISSLTSSPVIHPTSITILADDAYYTQSSPTTSISTSPVPHPETFFGQHFKYFGLRLWEAHKTGLGSSAALVTALTAGLLCHYLPEEIFDIKSETGKDVLHRLAQTAHCAAQGKVGSGFDVASAVYGTCVYRRFEPSLLSQLGAVGSPSFAKRLQDLVTDGKTPDGKEWDAEVSKSDGPEGIRMPKNLRLVMADVDCGSKTVGMVKKVLEWRKHEPDEADMLWSALQKAGISLGEELSRLSGSSSHSSGEYAELKARIERIRGYVRDMSRLSGVPIEPEEQTTLLNALSSVPGVIGGVVPGAGGFDALALIVEDRSDIIPVLNKKIEEINTLAKAKDEKATQVSLLDVKEDDQGVKKEDAKEYEAWIVRRETSQGK